MTEDAREESLRPRSGVVPSAWRTRAGSNIRERRSPRSQETVLLQRDRAVLSDRSRACNVQVYNFLPEGDT
jgi:hypothetical protein